MHISVVSQCTDPLVLFCPSSAGGLLLLSVGRPDLLILSLGVGAPSPPPGPPTGDTQGKKVKNVMTALEGLNA